MEENLREFFEAAKALIIYVDKEQVFDKGADMGCGGFDTYQSEAFYNLIVRAREALANFEKTLRAE
jgi:hypothetical protein